MLDLAEKEEEPELEVVDVEEAGVSPLTAEKDVMSDESVIKRLTGPEIVLPQRQRHGMANKEHQARHPEFGNGYKV